MVGDAAHALASFGALVLAGAAAAWGLRRFSVPDVLPLVALGFVAGPLLGWVDAAALARAAPLAGAVAIVLILFEGGLAVRREHLRGAAVSGLLLGAVVFALTAALCALAARHVGGLGWGPSWLLGLAFGGAGVAIVVPLARQLGVSLEALTVVSVEAAVSDVLVVVTVTGLASALALQGLGAGAVATSLLLAVGVGLAAGLAAGALWAAALRRGAARAHPWLLTVAALFLLYAACEALGGSGPLAALAFGLVLGNARGADGPVVTPPVEAFHREATFVVRAFFFVALGAALRLEALAEPRFLALGMLLAVVVAAARAAGVLAVVPRSALGARDRLVVAVMFPLGLAAAALSLLPWQVYGLPGTEDLAAYAAVAIVGTNVLCAAFVRVLPRRPAPLAAAATAPAEPV